MKFVAEYRASRKTTFEKQLLRQSFNVNEFIWTTLLHMIVTLLVYFIYVLYHLLGTEKKPEILIFDI